MQPVTTDPTAAARVRVAHGTARAGGYVPARTPPRPLRRDRAGPSGAGLDDVARVLAMVADPARPLGERIRLRAVLARHLDGVFRTRVAPVGDPSAGIALAVPVADRVLHAIAAEDDALVHDHLVPELRAAGVVFVDWPGLSRAEASAVRRLVRCRVHPLLTPMGVDGGRPFPALPSGSLTVVARVQVEPGTAPRLACVGLPPALPRTVRLGSGRVITAESLVAALLPDLFTGTRIVEHACLRVTRAVGARVDARPAAVTRVEIERTASPDTVDALVARLGTTGDHVYPVRSALAMDDALSAVAPDDPDEDGEPT